MEQLEEEFSLPEKVDRPGLRQLEPRDIPRCLELLQEQHARLGSELYRVFSEAELAHTLLPRPGVVSSWVLEDEGGGQVTDFFSYYSVPSNIVQKGEIVGEIKNGYLYYMANTSVTRKEMVHLMLVCAKNEGFDVATVLATSGLVADCVTEEHGNRFVKGTGLLRYYLFNWQGPPMDDHEVAFIAI